MLPLPRRSDERITEEVNQALADDDDIDASEIEVSVSSGEVTLSGTVPDRMTKRAAEDCAERVSGVTEVQNHVRGNRQGQGGEARRGEHHESSGSKAGSKSK